jgi:phytoene/squalene synthetase
VESGDPDRFLAAMTAPVAGRSQLFPLYACNLELAKAPWVTSEPMLAQIRLQWWQDVIDEVYDGKTPRQHEVVAPLADVIHGSALPQSRFSSMIEARRLDADRENIADANDAWAYARSTAGSLAELSVLALGATEEQARVAGRAGAAAGIGALVAAQPALTDSGVIRIPGDSAGSLAQEALAEIHVARRAVLPRKLAPALRHVWRVERILKCAAEAPQNVAALTDISDAARKFGYIWRSALGRW